MGDVSKIVKIEHSVLKSGTYSQHWAAGAALCLCVLGVCTGALKIKWKFFEPSPQTDFLCLATVILVPLNFVPLERSLEYVSYKK